jgi:hypothetical protein
MKEWRFCRKGGWEGGREFSSEAGATTTMLKSTSKKVNNLNVHILLGATKFGLSISTLR